MGTKFRSGGKEKEDILVQGIFKIAKWEELEAIFFPNSVPNIRFDYHHRV